MAAAEIHSPPGPVRLQSLDQFRGYTIFGMMLVNFLGTYAVCPRLLKHTNDYCSYADTIMPQFLFAAGFAMRLSLCRRREATGRLPWGRVLQRITMLALIATIWYSLGDGAKIAKYVQAGQYGILLLFLGKRVVFQTLLHIAVVSLWILPVVLSGWPVRFAYLFLSAVLHVVLSWWFNFAWIYADPAAIDGGPLGFLTWSIPALCGTLAYDATRTKGVAGALSLVVAGAALMLLGWAFSGPTVLYNVHSTDTALGQTTDDGATISKLASDPVIPSRQRWDEYDGTLVEFPFVPPPDSSRRQWNYWMMSQRAGTLSYLTFASGVSLVLFALFLQVCDGWGWNLGLFRTLGTNSLAAYLLHGLFSWFVEPCFPDKAFAASSQCAELAVRCSSLWMIDVERATEIVRMSHAMCGFAVMSALVYFCCRLLERRGCYIRV